MVRQYINGGEQFRNFRMIRALWCVIPPLSLFATGIPDFCTAFNKYATSVLWCGINRWYIPNLSIITRRQAQKLGVPSYSVLACNRNNSIPHTLLSQSQSHVTRHTTPMTKKECKGANYYRNLLIFCFFVPFDRGAFQESLRQATLHQKQHFAIIYIYSGVFHE